jgi:hypothetical protein
MGIRWLAWVLFLAALVFLAVAGYGFFAQPAAQCVVVDDTEIVVADGVGGQETIVRIHVRNDSGRPIRLLGAAEC